MDKVIRVEWTEKSESHLLAIFNYHSQFSKSRALKLIKSIKAKGDSIVFSKQYQVDEYNKNCRRMIFEDYKILFSEEDNIVYIIAVFPTKNDPSKLERL